MTAAHIESAPLRRSDTATPDQAQRVVAELLARIGLHLSAQRVELFAPSGTATRLAAWWGTLGHESEPADVAFEPELQWFPWSLGNLRPDHHLFVENAATLPSSPDGPALGSLGFGSALYLPISSPESTTPTSGSVCVYWTRQGPHWNPDTQFKVIEWVRTALVSW